MPDCRSCSFRHTDRPGPDAPARRQFLGRAVPALFVALAGLNVSVRDTEAWSVTEVRGALVSGERTYPIPAADGVVFDLEAEVIVVRRANQVVAFAQACPHEQAPLRWREGDVRFQCPRHESKYQADGTLMSGRARRNMDRLPIRRDGNTIVVDPSNPVRSDRQPAEWAAAVVGL